jgi:hypothetical protein
VHTDNKDQKQSGWRGLQYVLVATCMMVCVGIVAHVSAEAINQRLHAVIHVLKAR